MPGGTDSNRWTLRRPRFRRPNRIREGETGPGRLRQHRSIDTQGDALSWAHTATDQIGAQTSRAWSNLATWRCQVNQRSVRSRLCEFATALQALQVEGRGGVQTRRVLRETRKTLETVPYGSVAGAYFAMWIGLRIIKLSAIILGNLATTIGAEAVARAAHYFLWSLRPGVGKQPIGGWDSVIFIITFSLIPLLPIWWLTTRRWARGAVHRNRATLRALDALYLCAEAHRQSPGERASRLHDFDSALRRAEDAILHAHRHLGTIPRRSPRAAAARAHAALVVGALRAESLKIDADPNVALPRLGAMLAVIGERCAAGRIGAMLPEEFLAQATPISLTRTAIRESVHVAAIITAAMTAAVGAASVLRVLGVNENLHPWLTVGCSVLAAILVGGWHRVGRLLELLPGR
ncbi:hypothetical protein EES45_17090 [Streptomyces sp. ADI97-07]|nr:hypothetical protein EES45_17090 [Streptomyces sp. ADI97-07]